MGKTTNASGMLDAKSVVRLRLGIQRGGEFYGWSYNRGASALKTTVPHVKKAALGRGWYAKFKYAVEPVKFISDVYMCAVSHPGEQPMLPSPVSTEAQTIRALPSNEEPAPEHEPKTEEVLTPNVVAQNGHEDDPPRKAGTEPPRKAEEAQPMQKEKKKKKYLSMDEAIYARWLRVKRKWDVAAIADELDSSPATIYDVLAYRGKWESLVHIPVTAHDPRYDTSGRPEVTPAPHEMGSLGTALARAGVGPEDAQPKSNLEMSTQNWRWGRDSHDMRQTHLWRVYSQDNTVRTPCGRKLAIASMEPGRVKRYREGPYCEHCTAFFKSIVAASELEKGAKEGERGQNGTATVPLTASVQPPATGGRAPHASHGVPAASAGVGSEARAYTLTVPPATPAVPAATTTSTEPTLPYPDKGPSGNRSTRASMLALQDWLKYQLSRGPRKAAEVLSPAVERGYSRNAINLALDRMGGAKYGASTRTLWYLPSVTSPDKIGEAHEKMWEAPRERGERGRHGPFPDLEERERRRKWLHDTLSNGPIRSREMKKALEEAGLSEGMIRLAKIEPGISFMRDSTGRGIWFLSKDLEIATEMASNPEKDSVEEFSSRMKGIPKSKDGRGFERRVDIEEGLRKFLADGPKSGTQIRNWGKTHNVPMSTMHRALARIGAVPGSRSGLGGGYFWSLQDSDRKEATVTTATTEPTNEHKPGPTTAVPDALPTGSPTENLRDAMRAHDEAVRPHNYEAVRSVLSALVPDGDLRPWGYLRESDVRNTDLEKTAIKLALNEISEASELVVEAVRNLTDLLEKEG